MNARGSPLSKILNKPRLGFVAEHGSRKRPVTKRDDNPEMDQAPHKIPLR